MARNKRKKSFRLSNQTKVRDDDSLDRFASIEARPEGDRDHQGREMKGSTSHREEGTVEERQDDESNKELTPNEDDTDKEEPEHDSSLSSEEEENQSRTLEMVNAMLRLFSGVTSIKPFVLSQAKTPLQKISDLEKAKVEEVREKRRLNRYRKLTALSVSVVSMGICPRPASSFSHHVRNVVPRLHFQQPHQQRSFLHLFPKSDMEEDAIEEEARLDILQARRDQIRSTLKAAEGLRNFRRQNGWVPELDENGKPLKSDGKLAITLTAFVVAAGAIALRIGGRAALVSAVGLDFMNGENADLKENLEMVLTTAETMDPVTKVALFTAAWTAVKCLCFDAGGIVLALASGVLFGGVWQGAIISSAAATFGSSVAFGLAKLPTPVRTKALEILDEYPSLRGIEKTVARDGLKAILTLRLAPILPIPLGMYNYIYGVTNVGFAEFAGGIFLGGLKPYLLDSYLGYFGKSLLDGGTDDSGFQEILLLAALGVSVLIGVFASELASETWDSVLEEAEAEKKAKAGEDGEDDDGLMREFLGWELPEWMIGFQISTQEADERVRGYVATEYNAKVWNYTKAEGGPPMDLDPATFPDSPEVVGANKGLDVTASLCDGLVLSPILFESFLKYADPLFDETKEESMSPPLSSSKTAIVSPEAKLSAELSALRSQTEERISRLDDRLGRLSDNS